ncbi:MAG TPA: metallophosphoesterase [Pseudonocardiaceae bacterium]|nr:metallophosphoesterase [Pseudonocardiaceae bacterium]
MRIHLVSDVHGRSDALPAAGRDADALMCLGDLLLFLDYADYRQGIFADMFGAEQARAFMALRLAKRFDEARQLSARLAASLPEGSIRAAINAAAMRQYAGLFGALPEPAYLTYGNVDIPRMWAGHLKPGHQVLDGSRAELDGWTFGFVGGGLKSRYHTPHELDEDEYAAKLDRIGEVDVLCTHIPPALPELLYDTVARRMERGSAALLAAIRRTRPRFAFFGHVHQPLAQRVRVGVTECVNVGHFRATGVPYVLRW